MNAQLIGQRKADPGYCPVLERLAANETFEQRVSPCPRFRTSFDVAYQGFVTGDPDTDAWAIRYFVGQVFECLIAHSFSKNFGLYNVSGSPSQLVQSSEPWSLHMVLTDPDLRQRWLESIKIMLSRIREMRAAFRGHLEALGTPGNWKHITRQIGLFSFTGLSATQVEHLYKSRKVQGEENAVPRSPQSSCLVDGWFPDPPIHKRVQPDHLGELQVIELDVISVEGNNRQDSTEEQGWVTRTVLDISDPNFNVAHYHYLFDLSHPHLLRNYHFLRRGTAYPLSKISAIISEHAYRTLEYAWDELGSRKCKYGLRLRNLVYTAEEVRDGQTPNEKSDDYSAFSVAYRILEGRYNGLMLPVAPIHNDDDEPREDNDATVPMIRQEGRQEVCVPDIDTPSEQLPVAGNNSIQMVPPPDVDQHPI